MVVYGILFGGMHPERTGLRVKYVWNKYVLNMFTALYNTINLVLTVQINRPVLVDRLLEHTAPSASRHPRVMSVASLTSKTWYSFVDRMDLVDILKRYMDEMAILLCRVCEKPTISDVLVTRSNDLLHIYFQIGTYFTTLIKPPSSKHARNNKSKIV